MGTQIGYKDLLTRRMLLAIVSSIAVQFFLVSCLILITNLSADCSAWLQDTWDTITSFRMWSCFLVLASLTFLQGLVCSKIYLSPPPYLTSRFARLCEMFSTQNLLLAALYIAIGGILVWLHLSLTSGRYSSLTTNCSSDYGACLVEEHYFLLLSGLWSGLYSFVKTNFFNIRYLKFPVISQSKFVRLKRGICSMTPSLAAASLWPALYFVGAYYFLGFYCRTPVLTLMSVNIESELDSLPKVFNFSLIMHLWLYQLIFTLIINSMYLLFEVYLTEWVPFDFRETNVFNTASDPEVTLPEALAMDKVPIMQHLGYFDLVTLAQKERIRRSVLFTLSQPGGHPYNWNCVIEKCLELIKKFSNDLSAALIKPQDQPASSTLSEKLQTIQKDYTYHMRNLVTEPVSPMLGETDITEYPCNEPLIQRFLKSKWQSFIAYLLSKPLIYYIFGEQEDNKVRHVLFNGQPVIWAAEAISSLSVLSLTEDSYGIVQKDIPAIINTLLLLKQTLDKLQKSNILAKKQQTDDRLIKQSFVSLRSATKRSLYRIVTGFELYITDLGLDSVTIEQLQGFLNYKE